MLIKLGYSESIENRLRTHRRNDWIVLATGVGSKEREKAMLQTLRENAFRPEPSSEEIFTITPSLTAMSIFLEGAPVPSKTSPFLMIKSKLFIVSLTTSVKIQWSYHTALILQ